MGVPRWQASSKLLGWKSLAGTSGCGQSNYTLRSEGSVGTAEGPTGRGRMRRAGWGANEEEGYGAGPRNGRWGRRGHRYQLGQLGVEYE